MLAKQGDKALLEKPSPKWIFQLNFDGARVLIYKDGNDIELINKKGEDILYKYPELLDIPLNIKAKSCVLDAELVVLDKQGRPNSSLLQKREKLRGKDLTDEKSRQIPAVIFVSDLLEKDSQSFVDKQLQERKDELNKIIINSQFIKLCQTTPNGKALFNQAQKMGIKSITAKDTGSKYEQGKSSWQWLRISF